METLTDAVVTLAQQDAETSRRESRKTTALVRLTGLLVVLTLVIVGLSIALVVHL